ncbi:MAG: diacylglycerol kinase family lipid kinase [Candidatus Dormibacteraeota bacterium]|nr:diacylglycerol kinase family lipid kinase [Candidatus Dormibacteraeota bacterium]
MSTRSVPETLVVVNPASAGGRTLKHWPASAAVLRALGVDFEVLYTTAPGDATVVVRQALAGGARRIVSVGGDGTLNEVVNGFFGADGEALGKHAVLGVIPSGSGGDFRRTAGIPPHPVDAARLLANAEPRQVDVGRVDFDDGGTRYFINIADCGVGGEVVARVNRSRHKGGGIRGSAVFLWESISTLMSFGGRRARIAVDGHTVDREVQSVVVANGRYFGGGMRIAPDAELDDGLFDVVIVDAMGRFRSITSMPSLYRGSHVHRDGVVVLHGRSVRIEDGGDPLLFDVEGEQVGATPATLTCLPGALALCVATNTMGR